VLDRESAPRPAATVILALAVVVVANLVVYEPWEGYRRGPRPAIGDGSPRVKALRMLETRRPEIVAIGNSVTISAYDEELMTHVSGRSFGTITWGGSFTAWWYLVLKNVVVRHAPAETVGVVITFRFRNLTSGQASALVRSQAKLDDVADETEPDLDRLLAGTAPGLSYWLYRYVPLVRRRAEAAGWVEGLLKDDVVGPLFGLDRKGVDGAIERALAPELMDQGLMTIRQLEAERGRENGSDGGDGGDGGGGGGGGASFAEHVRGALLPAMLAVAKQRGLHLYFVRSPTRREIEAGGLDVAERAYLRQLSSYIEARGGASLVDLTTAAGLRPEHYRDAHHFGPEGRRLVTTALAGILRRPTPERRD